MNHPARRKILKLACALPVSFPVLTLAMGENNGVLSYHLVKNQVVASGVQAGALVLVDSSVCEFAGDGFYLYPDWGNPVVYEVKADSGKLAFHFPGRENSLWEMAAGHGGARFSGRVEGVIDTVPGHGKDIARLAAQGIRSLEVPELPHS